MVCNTNELNMVGKTERDSKQLSFSQMFWAESWWAYNCKLMLTAVSALIFRKNGESKISQGEKGMGKWYAYRERKTKSEIQPTADQASWPICDIGLDVVISVFIKPDCICVDTESKEGKRGSWEGEIRLAMGIIVATICWFLTDWLILC